MISCRQVVVFSQIFACVLASAQSTSLQRGVLSLQQGDYQSALRELKAASHDNPNDASIHNFIGISETQLGRIDDANQEYRTASRLDPNLAGPYKNLGFNYLNAGQYESAEAPLKTALSLNPTDPFVHYYLAILYLSTSRATEAIPQISPAQDFLGKDALNGMLAMKACLSSGHTDEALNLLHSLERESLLSFAQEYEVANLLTQRGLYVDAVPFFKKLVERQPGAWENKYNLAIAYLKAKQPENAGYCLYRFLRNTREMPISWGCSDPRTTLKVSPPWPLEPYRDAIEADPNNPDRYLDCTRVMVDLNQYEEASALLKKGIAASRDPYVLTIRIGAIEMMQGHFEKARDSFKEAVEEHPDVPLGYVALAQTYMKEGNNERAIHVLIDGRSKVAKDFALEYVLGLISFEAGQKEQALEALKNAEELGPGVVEPHYQLGMLYMQQHQWPEAQGEFESVLQINPRSCSCFLSIEPDV